MCPSIVESSDESSNLQVHDLSQKDTKLSESMMFRQLTERLAKLEVRVSVMEETLDSFSENTLEEMM